MADQKPTPKTNDIETLVIVRKCRVREVNKETAIAKQPGDKIEIRGLGKLELLHRGLATRDLDFKPKPAAGKPAGKPETKV